MQAKSVRNESSNMKKKEKSAPETEKVSARKVDSMTSCMHFQRGPLDFSHLKDLKLDTETPPKKVGFSCQDPLIVPTVMSPDR